MNFKSFRIVFKPFLELSELESIFETLDIISKIPYSRLEKIMKIVTHFKLNVGVTELDIICKSIQALTNYNLQSKWQH